MSKIAMKCTNKQRQDKRNATAHLKPHKSIFKSPLSPPAMLCLKNMMKKLHVKTMNAMFVKKNI